MELMLIGLNENPEDVPQEWLLERLRNWRNAELTACDWTQLADVDDVVKQAWVVYRQELRDLPSAFTSVEDLILPIKPSVN